MVADAIERLRQLVARPQYGIPESVRNVSTDDLKLLLKAYDALWEQAEKGIDSRQQY